MKTYYVGMDVHKATIVIAVLDAFGKVISQTIIETSTQALRDFFKSMRGEIHVTFEEGNHAAWLFDVIQPLVKHLSSSSKRILLGWRTCVCRFRRAQIDAFPRFGQKQRPHLTYKRFFGMRQATGMDFSSARKTIWGAEVETTRLHFAADCDIGKATWTIIGNST